MFITGCTNKNWFVDNVLFLDCITGFGFFPGGHKETIASKTPEQISQWSDERLCDYATSDNPAIKPELLKRGLLTEEEFKYVKEMESEHGNFPRVGMRKCAMWKFANYGEKLLSETKLSDGTLHEQWKIEIGGGMFFWGGDYYIIKIENDKITAISEPEPGGFFLFMKYLFY